MGCHPVTVGPHRVGVVLPHYGDDSVLLRHGVERFSDALVPLLRIGYAEDLLVETITSLQTIWTWRIAEIGVTYCGDYSRFRYERGDGALIMNYT